ncbi:MAG: Gfo/Idh/MocA family oxidoreductase [Verrucomicrobiae bacterium]|nr:Gfo/Idh/MocA family oxidoreductase [Verrucomicrobiae bacterium]
MNKTWRIGVIGLGARAESFSRKLDGDHPRAKLLAVCDLDADRLEKYCEWCGHGDVRRFCDPAEFFAQKDMDAVIITTPEFAHKESALAAIAAGKHFYLEKAMATNSEDCRAIIRAHRKSKVTAYLGFNMRWNPIFRRFKEIVDSGVAGQIVHVAGLEQLHQTHGAAFMRRFHRHSERSGGLLNTKCAHDLDMLGWLVGHKRRVVKVASFGGTNVFLPQKGPKGRGTHCGRCPEAIRRACPYVDRAGFVFPIDGKEPMHKTREKDVYGGDLCVYHDDKDLVDNQTVILEWNHGVRGNFNMQLFQNKGRRAYSVWGEKALVEMDTSWGEVRVTHSTSGEVQIHAIKPGQGGHGGADRFLIDSFLDAIETGRAPDSDLSAGLAATLLAEKADESRRTGKVIEIRKDEYL